MVLSVPTRERKPLPTAVDSYQDLLLPRGTWQLCARPLVPLTGDKTKTATLSLPLNSLAAGDGISCPSGPDSPAPGGTPELRSRIQKRGSQSWSASPALPAAVPKSPPGTFHSEDSGHINSPRVHPHSRPSSQRCHLAISSSVIPFSSCPQSLPASARP